MSYVYGDLDKLIDKINVKWENSSQSLQKDVFIHELLNICYENALNINGIYPGVSISTKLSFLMFSDTLQNILHSKRLNNNYNPQNRIEYLINLFKSFPPYIIKQPKDGEGEYEKEVVESGKYKHILDKHPWLASNIKERPPDILNMFLSRHIGSLNYINFHFHIFHFSNKTSSIDRNSTSAPNLSHAMYENSFRQFKKFTDSGDLRNDVLGSIISDIPLQCGCNNNTSIYEK